VAVVRTLCVAALAALVVTACASGAASRNGRAQLRLVKVGTFASPVYITAPRTEPNRLYVVEQAGTIRVLENGRPRATPFLDIDSQVLSGGEQGLLSVAFHPNYAENHLFYVDYTDRNGDTRIVEYRSDGEKAIPSSARQLVFVKDFASNHNGGQLQFGPDGRLWWGNGDGGGGGDPQHNGQSLSRPFAKIMRMNVANPNARWQLYAYGLRNPWRFSFDRANGDLYIADVGQGEWEEVDYVRNGAKARTPLNFGWNTYEGRHRYAGGEELLTRGRLVQPIAEYSHALGCSVTGGYVYRGAAVKAAVGRYFYGDYCSGTIWSLKVANGKATSVRREPFKVAGLSSFGEDARGELYLTSLDSGAVYRLAG
jgi:glucose/arabinose dehydrogenase